MSPHEPVNGKYIELAEGYEYPVSIITFNEQDIIAYLKATNDSNSIYFKLGMVPPLAVAARVLAELSQGIVSPPNTVHSSQELEFKKVIPIGEQFKLIAKVEEKLDRGYLHLLTTGFRIFDPNQNLVMAGKITVACRASEARWLTTTDASKSVGHE